MWCCVDAETFGCTSTRQPRRQQKGCPGRPTMPGAPATRWCLPDNQPTGTWLPSSSIDPASNLPVRLPASWPTSAYDDRGLLCLHTRCDRCDRFGRLAERGLTILNPVAPRYPCEVRIRSPHSAILVLEDEQPHGPIEACDGIGSYELRAQRRIPKDQKRGRAQFDVRPLPRAPTGLSR